MKRNIRNITFGAFVTLSVGASGVYAQSAGQFALGLPGGAGPTDVPTILAMESFAADGMETSTIEFDSPDIQTQALLNGDIQVALMGPATVFAANAAGADLRMIAPNNSIDLMVVAGADIATCEDLDGELVAYHSAGSTSTAHLRKYLEDTCPDATPNFVVISGSSNRAAALLEGQIAGTIVRLEDWLAVTGGNDERVRVLAMLSEAQATLLTSTIVVTASTLEENRPQLEGYLATLQDQYAAAYEDPAAYAALALPHLAGATQESMEMVFGALAEANLFPTDMSFSEVQVTDTLTFYENADRIDAGALSAADVADFSFSSN
ncbi:ABC transporter substrate-binding protein [Gymnodinialimonas sp. 57CJ19]|uniref:ABC transporter substrate-binding protein n=1 Tax=Gymnodinialimonas sp. 57CJ19 TaxID=3138498 RepID=UPI0031345568